MKNEMKKTVNKLLCVLLSAVMLFTLLPAFSALAGTAPSYAVGDHIEFGSYPQTRVEETGAPQTRRYIPYEPLPVCV